MLFKVDYISTQVLEITRQMYLQYEFLTHLDSEGGDDY